MNKAKRNEPISVRLLPEVQAELEKCAEALGLTRNALAQIAIEAAVEAVRDQEYQLVLPLKFATTHKPVAKNPAPTVKPTGPIYQYQPAPLIDKVAEDPARYGS